MTTNNDEWGDLPALSVKELAEIEAFAAESKDPDCRSALINLYEVVLRSKVRAKMKTVRRDEDEE